MTSQKSHITSFSSIQGNSAFLRDEHVFSNEAASTPDELLNSFYRALDPGYLKFFKMDNLSKLGFLATELLLKDIAISEKYKAQEVALLISNSSSSLDTDFKYWEANKQVPSPALFVYTLPNILLGELCIRHKIKGENSFFVSEQFDSGFIHNYAEALFEEGNTKACICGWVEILKNEYRAFLYLVEKNATENSVAHSIENINSIYIKQEHGVINN